MNNVCHEIQASIYEYLDLELSPEEESVIGQHLAICRECLNRFHFEARLLRVIREKCRDVSAPDRLRRRIEALIDGP